MTNESLSVLESSQSLREYFKALSPSIIESHDVYLQTADKDVADHDAIWLGQFSSFCITQTNDLRFYVRFSWDDESDEINDIYRKVENPSDPYAFQFKNTHGTYVATCDEAFQLAVRGLQMCRESTPEFFEHFPIDPNPPIIWLRANKWSFIRKS